VLLLVCCLALAMPRLSWAQETPVPKLVEQLDSMDPQEREQAAEQLSIKGRQARPAVPALLNALQKDPAASVRAAAAGALGRLGEALGKDGAVCVAPLTAALSDKELSVRLAAAGALEAYGNVPEVKASARARLDLFLQAASDKDPQTRQTALEGLLQMKSDRAIPLLLQLAENKDTNEQALGMLLRISERSKRVCVTEAQNLLASPDAEVRGHALDALANAGALGRVALPRLRDMAEHDADATVRFEAAYAIASLQNGAAATPYLLKSATDSDEKVAGTSLLLLGRGGDAAQAVPVVVKALDDARLATYALSALQSLGPAGAPAVPAVVRLVHQSTDSDVRQLALRTLAALGAAGGQAILADRKLITDTDLNVRLSYAEMLFRATGDGAEVLPTIAALLKASDERVRSQALALLAELRERARPLAPLVLAGLKDKTLGAEGLDVLAGMQLPAAQVLPVAEVALSDPDVGVRQRAVSLLAYSSSVPPGAVPLLRKALTDSDTTVQMAALDIYWRTTNDVSTVMPIVLATFSSGDANSMSTVFSVCRQMGPAGRAAIPAIVKAFDNLDRYNRVLCVEVLQEMGAEPAVVVPMAVACLQGNEVNDTAYNLLDRYAPSEIVAALGATDPTPLCEYLAVILRHVSDTPDDATMREHKVMWLCDILGPLGGRARAAVGPLTAAAQHDEDATVQDVARETLAKIGK
jgi:HEAT repeat protein